MEEALFLTKFASKVIIIHRRKELRASQIMQTRALEHPKIEFAWNSEVVQVIGDHDKGTVSGVEAITHPNDAHSQQPGSEVEKKVIACDGMFLGIGHIPNTEFLKGVLELDKEGYVVTVKGDIITQDVQTKLPAVYAAGDVVDTRYRQAITAAGMGCKAAIEAEEHIAAHPA